MNAAPTTPNAKVNYALTTRRVWIVELTGSIQLLADRLEYCSEFASDSTQHALLLALARKYRLVTVCHLIMSRRQPQAADLICPHLAVKHTNTLYDQVYAQNKAQSLQVKAGFLQDIGQQNKWSLVVVRQLLHQHQKLLPGIICNLSTSMHQAHLCRVWEQQMVTNIQQARFLSVYQQLRAQTRASEQWSQVHQISDAIVQFLDTSQESSHSRWQLCTEVDPSITQKVKRAAKRHRRKAKEATQKAVPAATEHLHLHAPIGGYSGLQQRASMKSWHVTPDPNDVRGQDPSVKGPCSSLDLRDIDTRVTKDLCWKLGQAKAQINRSSTHYRKRYRPGRHSYHRSRPAQPVLSAMATALCLMATLTSSVALGTSALTTAVVTVGTNKTLQYMNTSSHQKKSFPKPNHSNHYVIVSSKMPSSITKRQQNASLPGLNYQITYIPNGLMPNKTCNLCCKRQQLQPLTPPKSNKKH